MANCYFWKTFQSEPNRDQCYSAVQWQKFRVYPVPAPFPSTYSDLERWHSEIAYIRRSPIDFTDGWSKEPNEVPVEHDAHPFRTSPDDRFCNDSDERSWNRKWIWSPAGEWRLGHLRGEEELVAWLCKKRRGPLAYIQVAIMVAKLPSFRGTPEKRWAHVLECPAIDAQVLFSLCDMVLDVGDVVEHGEGDSQPVPLPYHAHLCSIRFRRSLLFAPLEPCYSLHEATKADEGGAEEYITDGSIPSWRTYLFEHGYFAHTGQHCAYYQGAIVSLRPFSPFSHLRRRAFVAFHILLLAMCYPQPQLKSLYLTCYDCYSGSLIIIYRRYPLYSQLQSMHCSSALNIRQRHMFHSCRSPLVSCSHARLICRLRTLSDFYAHSVLR